MLSHLRKVLLHRTDFAFRRGLSIYMVLFCVLFWYRFADLLVKEKTTKRALLRLCQRRRDVTVWVFVV